MARPKRKIVTSNEGLVPVNEAAKKLRLSVATLYNNAWQDYIVKYEKALWFDNAAWEAHKEAEISDIDPFFLRRGKLPIT